MLHDKRHPPEAAAVTSVLTPAGPPSWRWMPKAHASVRPKPRSCGATIPCPRERANAEFLSRMPLIQEKTQRVKILRGGWSDNVNLGKLYGQPINCI
jgi:hypothetical protein